MNPTNFEKRIVHSLDPDAAEPGPVDLSPLGATSGDKEFVALAYRLILGREADAEGIASCLTQLRRGAGRAAVAKALMASAEAASRGRTFTGFASGAAGGGALGSLRQRIRDRAVTLAKRIIFDRLDALDRKSSYIIEQQAHRLDRLEARLNALEAQAGALAARPRAIPVSDGALLVETEGLFFATPAEAWELAGHLAFHGTLEPGLVRRVIDSLAPGMVFVDVGANIGLFTVRAARAVGACGRVYAYEPAPRTASMLERNVAINSLPSNGHVAVRRAAVSDQAGEATFTVYPSRIGHSTLFANHSPGDSITVPTVTLDQDLAAEPIVDVVKIDAEGAEPLVFAGMRRLAERNPRLRIFLEFAPQHLARAGATPAGFLAAIRAAGFLIEHVDDVTGALQPAHDTALAECDSANLQLTRP